MVCSLQSLRGQAKQTEYSEGQRIAVGCRENNLTP